MAVVPLYEADFDDSNVTMLITLDDVSLVVQQLIYHNATSQGGALMLTGPKTHTYQFPPNNDQTIDLTPLNIVCVKRTGVGKFGPYTAYDLPNGEQISFQWPA
jgi:hypothetical protein